MIRSSPWRPGRRPGAGIGWRRANRAAFAGALRRPGLWPFALLAFLLRGGWFLFLLPIVVFPSTVGVSTFVGPLAVTPAGPSDGFLRLVGGVLVALAAWIIVGGLLAAACEAIVVRESLAADVGHRLDSGPGTISIASRVLLARIVATIPLIVVIAWAIPRAVSATYTELILPVDPAVPLPVRVLRDLPDVIAVVVAAWFAVETIGAIAARRVVLSGDGSLEAVLLAIGHLIRHPLASAATAGLTIVGSILLVGPALAVAGLAWDRLAAALPADGSAVPAVALCIVFVLAWSIGLLLAGASSSWRSVAWTLEVRRLDRHAAAFEAPATASVTPLVESEGTVAAS